jgi:hypothetical protein
VKPKANKETKVVELEIKNILLTEVELKDIDNPTLLEEVDESDIDTQEIKNELNKLKDSLVQDAKDLEEASK